MFYDILFAIRKAVSVIILNHKSKMENKNLINDY